MKHSIDFEFRWSCWLFGFAVTQDVPMSGDTFLHEWDATLVTLSFGPLTAFIWSNARRP